MAPRFTAPSELAPSWRTAPILVVDKEKAVCLSLARNLEFWGERVLVAENGEQALELLEEYADTFLVLLDLAMPGLGGVGLIEELGKLESKADVVLMTDYLDPSLALSLLKHGAFDYLRKPFLIDEVKHIVRRVKEHQGLREKALELKILEETKRVERENLVDFMIGLANLIDAKSPYTKEHSDRVAAYSRAFARALAVTEREYQDISFGSKLHDIGKVGVPDRVLENTGRLSKEEWEIMMDHPVAGARILEPVVVMKGIIPMVLRHHENWDGSGYPDGLEGEETPTSARIVKIADYYDAITSERPYREPMPIREAIKLLDWERERILDPELTKVFIELVKSGKIHESKIVPLSGQDLED